MASAGGHWSNLAAAAKLTGSTKIPGVMEEDKKRNNPIERVPVVQGAGTGTKIEWLREQDVDEDDVVEAESGDELVSSENLDYDAVESTLRYLYIQRKLDGYVEKIYGTYTDYKARVLIESEKKLLRKCGDRFIYADTTYGGSPTQFDGLHALAAERGTPWAGSGSNSKLNMDMATGALSLLYLRTMIDAMKHGIDEILIPGCIGIRFDQAYDEKGFTYAVSSNATYHYSLITRGMNDLGRPITYFMGIPLTRTDYLVGEQDGTGTGATSNKRGKYSSGTQVFSLFCLLYGNVLNEEPGLSYAFGGTTGEGDFYDMWTWDRLPNFNAAQMRLDHYGAVLLGSTMGLGRIADITDAALVA